MAADEDPEGEGETDNKPSGSKWTVKRRLQRKRAKEKHVTESTGECVQAMFPLEAEYLESASKASYCEHMVAVSNGWVHMLPAPPHEWVNPYMLHFHQPAYGDYVSNNWYHGNMAAPMSMLMM